MPWETLMEVLQTGAKVAVLVFVISSMLTMGLSLTIAQIVAPLRNLRLVALALLGNFVLMPLGAVVLSTLLRLDPPLGVGLLLLGLAAGAPFLPKLAEIAKGNLAFAVGLMVLLMVVTVGYLPLVLPLLLEGSLGQSGEDRSLPRSAHASPSGCRPSLQGSLRTSRRASKTPVRSDLDPEPRFAGVTDIGGQHQKRAGRIRHTRHPGRGPLCCARLRHRVALRGAWQIRSGCWPWAPDSAISLRHSWSAARASVTRRWSSW